MQFALAVEIGGKMPADFRLELRGGNVVDLNLAGADHARRARDTIFDDVFAEQHQPRFEDDAQKIEERTADHGKFDSGDAVSGFQETAKQTLAPLTVLFASPQHA